MTTERSGVRDDVQAAVGNGSPIVGNEQLVGDVGDDGEPVKGPADDRLKANDSNREIDQFVEAEGEVKGPHPDQWPEK